MLETTRSRFRLTMQDHAPISDTGTAMFMENFPCIPGGRKKAQAATAKTDQMQNSKTASVRLLCVRRSRNSLITQARKPCAARPAIMMAAGMSLKMKRC
ncbi:hypothetical protein DSECCO2_348240 [anaerobic digester metagenome]